MPTASRRPSPHRFPTRLLFAGLTALSIATGSGHFYASDEEKMYATTLRLWSAIQALFDPSITPETPILSVYCPMQSVVALLLLPVGKLLAALGPTEMEAWLLRLPATWGNAVVVAAVATLLGWVVSQRLQRPLLGVAVTLTYGLATPAWQYAGSFFSEPIASLWLLCALLPVLVGAVPGALTPRRLLLSGLACLPALLAKIAVAPAIAVIGLCVVVAGMRRRAWADLAWWCAGAAGAGAAFLAYNLFARGSLLSSGYNQSQQSFALDWGTIITGLHGQFLSSGKSIFLYAPLLLLWPLGVWLWRREWELALAPLAVVAALTLVHTNVVFWHGDGAWGPRYVVLALPFMVLPVAAAYDWLGTQRRGLRWAILVPLVVATIAVQIPALAINPNAYIIDTRDERARYYEPTASPIAGQWRMLVAQLTRDVNARFADGVTLRGWSYSEGDRVAGEQFPRFASTDAAVVVRAPTTSVVRANLHTCIADTAQPVTVRLDRSALTTLTLCPPRTLQLLLPAGTHTLTLQSAGVAVAGLPQHEWYPLLGPVALSLQVRSAGAVLPIWANTTPPSRMPALPNAMRVWASDSRTAFYDVWWSYLTVPASGPIWPVLLAVWAVVVALVAVAVWPDRREATQ
ncbi:MAG: hypothetical protein RLZZ297_710 [Chloroflexota bacterium]